MYTFIFFSRLRGTVHRIRNWLRLEGTNRGYLVQTACSSRDTLNWLLRTTSKDGDSTTSPGNLFQCSVTLPREVFPDFREEPETFQCVPIASCPVTWAPVKRVWCQLLCTHPFRYFHILMRSPPQACSSPGWAINLSWEERCSSHFNSFVTLHMSLFSMCKSLLYWGIPICTQYCSCDFITAEERGGVTSLDLLATFLLMQPKMMLASFTSTTHWWLMF